MNRIIYLDNAATTPVRKEVLLAMKPYWNTVFGNPGSITKLGAKAKKAVDDARVDIAECLKARPVEIIFTSGGTESNNLAIFGLVNILEKKGRKVSTMHFITTNIEHSSITECFNELERSGAKVDHLEVDEEGLVNPKDLRKLIRPNTVLVSVGYANGEIGTIQPIKEIAKEIRHARKCLQGGTLNLKKGSTLKTNYFPLFHTDASQAGLYCNLNVNELGVDLLTLDAQKMYGPKGVGVLFKKSTAELSPLIFGGGQEGGLRSGTENVPLIVGMAKALEIAREKFQGSTLKSLESLRKYFWKKIQKEVPGAVLNGHMENRLPNNLNISLPGVDTEFLVLCLDEAGIVCSTKSACSHDENGSAVVRALYKHKGLAFEGEALAKATLRFSLGEDITKKDIDYVVATLKREIGKQKKL